MITRKLIVREILRIVHRRIGKDGMRVHKEIGRIYVQFIQSILVKFQKELFVEVMMNEVAQSGFLKKTIGMMREGRYDTDTYVMVQERIKCEEISYLWMSVDTFHYGDEENLVQSSQRMAFTAKTMSAFRNNCASFLCLNVLRLLSNIIMRIGSDPKESASRMYHGYSLYMF